VPGAAEIVRLAIRRMNLARGTRQKQARGATWTELDAAIGALTDSPITVGLDYHVEVDRHHYSMPHRLLRQKVWARATEKTVEIILIWARNGGRTLSQSTPRLLGRRQRLDRFQLRTCSGLPAGSNGEHYPAGSSPRTPGRPEPV
jgi:hypothetical protein